MTSASKTPDRAGDDDVWFRPLLNTDYVRGGRIHHSALTGKSPIAPPRRADVPWKAETSGRLRSLVTDAVKDGDAQAAANAERAKADGNGTSKIAFVGVIFEYVSVIRGWADLQTDVFHTPTDDPAHADLVYQHDPPKLLEMRARSLLQERLRLITDADLRSGKPIA